MNLYFFIEARLPRYKGREYLPDMFGEKVLSRYLEVFDSISIICRVFDVDSKPGSGFKPISDKRISVIALPCYDGFGYLKAKRNIKSLISPLLNKGNAYLCRIPGQIGTLAADLLKHKNIPYAVEVVGDPWESLSYQAFRSVLSPLLQVVGRNNLRRSVKNSSAALYVTEYVLQKKYPVKKGVFTTNASNVELFPEYFTGEGKNIKKREGKFNLMSIGTLAQMYKAPDIVLKGLSGLAKRGIDFRFTWYGAGKFREQMLKMADELGLSDKVVFAGNVSHEELMCALNDCDLLIHVSRAEGLPRAVIEAMAHAVPVIGTSVAGIPELLLPDAIIPVNNAKALTSKLENFLLNDELRKSHSHHNIEKAAEFDHSILAGRRKYFYERIKALSNL